MAIIQGAVSTSGTNNAIVSGFGTLELTHTNAAGEEFKYLLDLGTQLPQPGLKLPATGWTARTLGSSYAVVEVPTDTANIASVFLREGVQASTVAEVGIRGGIGKFRVYNGAATETAAGAIVENHELSADYISQSPYLDVLNARRTTHIVEVLQGGLLFSVPDAAVPNNAAVGFAGQAPNALDVITFGKGKAIVTNTTAGIEKIVNLDTMKYPFTLAAAESIEAIGGSIVGYTPA